MHEMALMGEIVELLEQDAMIRNIHAITRVEVKVGTLSNVLPEALEMAFDAYKLQPTNRLTETAQLIIHIEQAKAVCVICGQEYEPASRIAQCPSCQFLGGKMVAGETFQLLAYEGS